MRISRNLFWHIEENGTTERVTIPWRLNYIQVPWTLFSDMHLIEAV